MARRRKSSQSDEEETRPRSDGLSRPYSARVGGNKYVIYAYRRAEGETHNRVLVLTFLAPYAARRFIDVLVGKDGYEGYEIGSKTGIITTSGVKITAFGNAIRELLEYEMTKREAEWRDPRMEESAGRLKFGATWETPKVEMTVEETVEDEETGELVTRKVKVKKAKKDGAEKKEKKPKLDRSGMVTAGDLAKRLGIEPRIFRGALRALKKVKPTGGWLWTKDEAESMFKEVTAFLEKDAKKGKKK